MRERVGYLACMKIEREAREEVEAEVVNLERVNWKNSGEKKMWEVGVCGSLKLEKRGSVKILESKPVRDAGVSFEEVEYVAKIYFWEKLMQILKYNRGQLENVKTFVLEMIEKIWKVWQQSDDDAINFIYTSLTLHGFDLI